MRGLVIKTTGKEFLVAVQNGDVVSCSIKGNFRIKGIKSTNPVAVGDWVLVDDNRFIYQIEERKNYVVRKPSNLSKQLHIIAANIDQALLVVTVKNPETSTVFIDRFLASAEAYSIPVIIVFNKMDLLSTDDLKYVETLSFLYENIGYRCIRISSIANCDALRPFLQGKLSLLTGNSGVGKSTIVNTLCSKEVARTAEISAYHHAGMHTTTFSEIHRTGDISIIDTPGIKGFGTVDLSKETGHYFREIFRYSEQCRFNNCTHTHEPGCAVIEAVENKLIAASRYQSYLSIMGDENAEKYRK